MRRRMNRWIALAISAVLLTADISVPVFAADIAGADDTVMADDPVSADEVVSVTDTIAADDPVQEEAAFITEDVVSAEETLSPDQDTLTEDIDLVSEDPDGSAGPDEDVINDESADRPDRSSSKYISPVAVGKPSRDQGNFNSSISFSVAGAIEMSAAKKGIKLSGATDNDPVDLSELHLAYFMGKDMAPYDPLGGFKGDRNKAVDGDFINCGSREIASEMLVSWTGAAAESKYPYSRGASFSTQEQNAFDDVLHVSGYYVADPVNYRDEVKELVEKYGAATIGFYSYEAEEEEATPPIGLDHTYDEEHNSYCLPTQYEANHSALIIGWDDDFSKNDFAQTARGDGAWLIRDSWDAGNTIDANGVPSGDDAEYFSYFWLSYYDGSIASYSSMAYDVDKADKYDHNYQYDGARTSSQYAATAATKYANIFTCQAKQSEYLKAVYFDEYNPSLNYKIEIYKGVTYGRPESGKLEATQSGRVTYPGGHTIELDKPVFLRKGENFSVVITVPEYTLMKVEYSQVPVESWTETTALTVSGRSMIYEIDRWLDSNDGNSKTGDIRIKAFTKEDDDSDSITVTFDAGSGVCALASKVVKKDEAYGTLPEAEWDGHDFAGWFTSPDGGDQVLEDTTVTSTANHTLYAHWDSVKIRVNLNPGTNATVSPSYLDVTYGGKYAGLINPTSYDPKQIFTGWYTEAEGGTKVKAETTVTNASEHTLYARYTGAEGDESEITEEDKADIDSNALESDGFWVRGVPSVTAYTGSPIKFDDLRLYKGNKRLVLGRDYTLVYRNNTNAYTLGEGDPGYLPAKSPIITINAKGCYSGKKEIRFKITPVDLEEADHKGKVYVAPVYLKDNGNVQKGKTTVYYMPDNGKALTLKMGPDYEYRADSYASVKAEPGDYTVALYGKGNYTGKLTFKQTITPKNGNVYDMSTAIVKPIPARQATGRPVTLADKDLVVTYRTKSGTVTLDTTNYSIVYVNNVLPGMATVILEGKDGFTGTKTATFRINARMIVRAAASFTDPAAASGYTYTGAPITPAVKVTYTEKPGMSPEELKAYSETEPYGDYALSYKNNVNAGRNRATALIDGKNAYTGTLKKMFTINQVDLADTSAVCVTVLDPVTGSSAETVRIGSKDYPKVAYQKLGTKPGASLVFHGLDKDGNAHDYTMVEGTDYTILYRNNMAVDTSLSNPMKKPTMTINGKGNFKGSRVIEFAIDAAKITNATVAADDVVYANRAGNASTKVTVKDSNGKLLIAGVDYERDVKFVYKTIPTGTTVYDKNKAVQSVSAGDPVDIKNHIVPLGT
nr:InlB B-repeat-containing protein [Lachnospiraceae bacterium]